MLCIFFRRSCNYVSYFEGDELIENSKQRVCLYDYRIIIRYERIVHAFLSFVSSIFVNPIKQELWRALSPFLPFCSHEENHY